MNSVSTSASLQALLITETDLRAWVGQASPNETIEYHRGFLVVDTDARIALLPGSDREELANVARRAWQGAPLAITLLR